jgi:porin
MKPCLGLIATSLLISASPAFAEDFKDRLTGDWGGHRSQLYAQGVDIEAIYSTGLWNNFSGGTEDGGTQFDNTDLAVTLDGEKLYGLPGSTIFIYGLKNTGGEINGKNVGSHGGIDNIEVSKSTAKIYEAWIEQNFLENRLSVKTGLYDYNSEFYVTETSGLFLNPTYGIGTELAATGENGPSIFPTTSLAARIKVQVTPELYAQAVIMDGVPGDIDDPKGTQISLGNGDGAFVGAELGYQSDITGYIGLGAWHYTEQFDDFVDVDANGDPERAHNQGAYILFDKPLMENLSGFMRLGVANGDVSNFDFGWSTGLVLTSFIPGREEGQLGLAVSGTHNSDKFKQSVIADGNETDTNETQVELTYRDQILPWLAVQPDIQYTHNPGTDPTLDDSWAGGLRVEISF